MTSSRRNDKHHIDEFLPIFLERNGLKEAFEKEIREHASIQNATQPKKTMPKKRNSITFRLRREKFKLHQRAPKSKPNLVSAIRSFAGSVPDLIDMPQKKATKRDSGAKEASLHQQREANLPFHLFNIRQENKYYADHFPEMAISLVRTFTSYLSSEEGLKDWVFAWNLDKDSDLVRFLDSFRFQLAILLKQAKYGKAARCISSFLITVIDAGTDYALAGHYFSIGESNMAWLTLSLPFISQILQMLFSISDSESLFVVIASLFGFKPLIDTIRVVTGASRGGNMHPIAAMTISRGMEVTFESIPQLIIQLFQIISLSSVGRSISATQYFAVASSMLAAGFVGANNDYDLDTIENYRKVEHRLYGWIPPRKQTRLFMMFLHMLHLGSFCGLRCIGYSTLFYSMPLSVSTTWVASEFALHTVFKIWFNTYWCFQPAPAFISHVV